MIPVFEPNIGDEEIAEVVAALRRGEISGTFGEAIPRFENMFAEFCGTRHAVAVTSGTTALQLAVRVAGIGTGDEVLISATTNIATALAVVYNNAVPIPVDSEPETWNMDPALLEGMITPRTRAIIPVHHLGHLVDMDRVMAVARRHGLLVIEDAAEAHGAMWRGVRAGAIGQMGCFSFYANKVITTGEGGMIVTNDDAFAEKMRLLRNQAFTRPRYRHEELGYNFRMTGYQAAMGIAQMRKIDIIIETKRRLAGLYARHLSDIPEIQLPKEHPDAFHIYWMYGIVVRPEARVDRNDLQGRLAAKGIDTRTFFCPMNQQPCLQALAGFPRVECPVADRLWESGLYLPSSYSLGEEQVEFIADSLRKSIQ